MNDFFVIQPCKGKSAFSSTLKRKRKIDLDKVKDKLDNVLASTLFLIVVKYKGLSISIYNDCKLLINTNDKEKAERIAEEIYERVLE